MNKMDFEEAIDVLEYLNGEEISDEDYIALEEIFADTMGDDVDE